MEVPVAVAAGSLPAGPPAPSSARSSSPASSEAARTEGKAAAEGSAPAPLSHETGDEPALSFSSWPAGPRESEVSFSASGARLHANGRSSSQTEAVSGSQSRLPPSRAATGSFHESWRNSSPFEIHSGGTSGQPSFSEISAARRASRSERDSASEAGGGKGGARGGRSGPWVAESADHAEARADWDASSARPRRESSASPPSLGTAREEAGEGGPPSTSRPSSSALLAAQRGGGPADGEQHLLLPNGAQYFGQVRGDLPEGRGVLVWPSGDRYEGEVCAGLPHGVGTLVSPGRGVYYGHWLGGLMHGDGVFRPAAQQGEEDEEADELGSGDDRRSFVSGRRSLADAGSDPEGGSRQLSPRHVTSRPSAARGSGKQASPRRASKADAPAGASGQPASPGRGAQLLCLRRYELGQLAQEEILRVGGPGGPERRLGRRKERKKAKASYRPPRPGETIFKGHRSYDLVRSLQMGITFSTAQGAAPLRDLSRLAEQVARAGWSLPERALARLRPSGASGASALAQAQDGLLRLSSASSWEGDAEGGPRPALSSSNKTKACSFLPLPSSTQSGGLPSSLLAPASGTVLLTCPRGSLSFAYPPPPPPFVPASLSHVSVHSLLPSDYAHSSTHLMPASGDTGTFEWKDYSPRVFCALRAALGVDNAEYLLSLTKEGALRRLPSPGKSGSVFFLSDDGRFVIKSVRKGELRLLQRLLPAYCEHVAKFPRTLLNHFYGLHRVAPLAGRRVRFLVMGNVFPTDLRLHRKYDLKGSALGRTSFPAGLSDPWAMLKDLDLDVTFLLTPEHHAALARQLARDCALLEAAHVMDYSLLLGVHYVRWGNRAWAPPRGDWARARETAAPEDVLSQSLGVAEAEGGGGKGKGEGEDARAAALPAAWVPDLKFGSLAVEGIRDPARDLGRLVSAARRADVGRGGSCDESLSWGAQGEERAAFGSLGREPAGEAGRAPILAEISSLGRAPTGEVSSRALAGEASSRAFAGEASSRALTGEASSRALTGEVSSLGGAPIGAASRPPADPTASRPPADSTASRPPADSTPRSRPASPPPSRRDAAHLGPLHERVRLRTAVTNLVSVGQVAALAARTSAAAAATASASASQAVSGEGAAWSPPVSPAQPSPPPLVHAAGALAREKDRAGPVPTPPPPPRLQAPPPRQARPPPAAASPWSTPRRDPGDARRAVELMRGLQSVTSLRRTDGAFVASIAAEVAAEGGILHMHGSGLPPAGAGGSATPRKGKQGEERPSSPSEQVSQDLAHGASTDSEPPGTQVKPRSSWAHRLFGFCVAPSQVRGEDGPAEAPTRPRLPGFVEEDAAPPPPPPPFSSAAGSELRGVSSAAETPAPTPEDLSPVATVAPEPKAAGGGPSPRTPLGEDMWAGLDASDIGFAVPALAVQTVRDDGPVSGPEPVLLYFGIIDFLQDYTLRKRLEKMFKREDASVASPGDYATRFQTFLSRLFLPSAMPTDLGDAAHWKLSGDLTVA